MARQRLTRRQFVSGTGQAALSAMIVPRHVLGRGFQAPSDTLNVAVVGAGGKGMDNARALTSQNIVAVCDVDFGYVEKQLAATLKPDRNGRVSESATRLKEAFGKAKRYADFREMFDQQKDIEGVVIATPDHAHAVIAKTAMQAGKHVYVQKPLTHSVYEARTLGQLARTAGVVTQMGNQGHSSNEARLINEWVQAGIIGKVREVHVWTNRPIWPQGLLRPTAPTPPPENPGWSQGRINLLEAQAMWGDYPIPPGLDWDLYLGPVNQPVAYHPVYHPFNWRGWLDFGVGAIGDMGAHLIDHPYWALGLDLPTTIEATSSPWGAASKQPPVSYPLAMTVHYEFAARGELPPVRLSWYDGGLMPARPEGLPDNITLNREGGVIFVGEHGLLMHETYGQRPRLFPESLMDAARSVPQTYPRIEASHEMNWALACKGQGQTTSPLTYAARLTETMLLGIVALRAGQGRKITYDGEAMRVVNAPEADAFLKRDYRKGFEV